MSYRELRNFSEMMRSLGYTRLISMENFRKPNFVLVADILHWMVHRYDPNVRIDDTIDSEEDRIEFLTSVAAVMASKARIKLNLKRLYAADGHAVKELLKIASILYKALKSSKADRADDAEDAVADAALTRPKPQDLKQARDTASEIMESGAKLYDLLGKEEDLNRSREHAIRFLDAAASNLDNSAEQAHVERTLKELLSSSRATLQQLEEQVQELQADESALTKKISKRKKDLDRANQRLAELKEVRPAFMDEYERLEEELQDQYQLYVERFRNLDYLEGELDKINKAEQRRMQENEKQLRRMQDKLKKKEEAEFRGEHDFGDALLDMRPGAERPSAAAPRRRGPGGKVEGTMRAGGDSSSTGSGSGSGSGSSLGSDDDDSLGDDEDLSGSSLSDTGSSDLTQ